MGSALGSILCVTGQTRADGGVGSSSGNAEEGTRNCASDCAERLTSGGDPQPPRAGLMARENATGQNAPMADRQLDRQPSADSFWMMVRAVKACEQCECGTRQTVQDTSRNLFGPGTWYRLTCSSCATIRATYLASN